jgi:hypothetical protein
MECLWDQAIPPGIGINSNKIISDIHIAYTWKLVIALWTISKRLKQPKYPLTDKQVTNYGISMQWQLGCSISMKRKWGVTHAITWGNPENIVINERNLAQEFIYYIILIYIEMSRVA